MNFIFQNKGERLMRIQRKKNRVIGAIFTLILLLVPNTIKPAIPAIKGLYNLFTPDVIGIGQALLVKGWIENIYTYAPDDNLAKKVIQAFWNKNRNRLTGQINELDNFVTKNLDPIKGITASDLGKILKYIHDFKESDKTEIYREKFVKSLSKKTKEKWNKQGYISEILKNLEALKFSEDFIPETAEAILWAFFDSKFKTKKDLDDCLKELGKSIGDQEYPEGEYKNFENEVKELVNLNDCYENQYRVKGYYLDKKAVLEKIIKEYDRSTYSSITSANIKIIPTKIEQITTSYKFDGEKTEPFPTCFESAILDTISILFYDPKDKVYSLKMLPSVAKSNFFLKTLRDVFKYEDGNFISPKNINFQTEAWINLIENRPWLNYSESENIDKEVVRYDLNPTFENLIKVMYNFYSLGFDLKPDTSESEIIKVFPDKLEINTSGIVEKPKDAKDFWDKIFAYISKKFSTEDRKVIFSVVSLDSNNKFEFINNKVISSGSCGKISVEIEYLKSDYKEFNADFDININNGHAFISSKVRDSAGLRCYDRQFKHSIYDSVDKKVLPLSILFVDLEMPFLYHLKDKSNKIKNIYYYSQELRSSDGKFNTIKNIITIKNIFNESSDKSLKKLLNSLVDKITNDFYFISDIVYWMIAFKAMDDELLGKLINKNSGAVLSVLCSEKSLDEKLKNFATKVLDKPDAEVSVLDQSGYTPLYYAQENGHLDIAEKFLKHNKLKDFDKIIYYIMTDKDKEAIELIKKKDVDISGPAGICNTPLREAIKKNKIDVVKELLKNDAVDINKSSIVYDCDKSSSSNPIKLAAEQKNNDIAMLLLDHKKNDVYDIDLSEMVFVRDKACLSWRANNKFSKEVADLMLKRFEEIEKQKTVEI